MSVLRAVPVRIRAALLMGVVSLAMAGCQTDRIVTGSVPADYRDRHPIQINEGIRSVQLFVGSGRAGLTPEQRALAGGFASQWRRYGSGPLKIELPAGTAIEMASSHTVRELQSVLASSGVPLRAIQVRSYQPQDPSNVAPIRLTFPALKAQVASRCHAGQEDLGPTINSKSDQNYSTRNFGCATQQNLAAQVANPEDLVQPRNEAPAYAARRRNVLEKYSKGQDPSTVYNSTNNGKVSNVGN